MRRRTEGGGNDRPGGAPAPRVTDLETIICGQFTVTYNSVALGIFEGDAGSPGIERINHGAPIANTDAYGKTMLDYIYQGVDYVFSGVCMEYKAGPIAAWYPWSATAGALGTIGRLAYAVSLALVLTAVSGTPAAATPATLTASRAIIPPTDTSKIMFGPMVRTVPLRLQLLPYTSGSVIFYSQT